MHVCILTSARIFEIVYGGEGRFTISLGNWLYKKGYETTLMASTFAGIKAVRLSRGNVVGYKHQNRRDSNNASRKIKVLYPPYPVYLASRVVLSLFWTIKILLLNMKSPVKLIHAQDTGYSGLAAVLASRFIGVPVIISSHGIRHRSLESVIRGKLRNVLLGIEKRVDFFTIKNANGVIAINTAVRDYFEKVMHTSIEFIPIPIKVSDFTYSLTKRRKIRSEFGIAEDIVVVGFVGRFSQEKNLFMLLDAFANVLPEIPSAILLMVGTGSLESQLKKYVTAKGITNAVIFCGVRDDIGILLSALDIFVLPSFTEGLPTALLEAMAASRAVICSDIAGNRQLVRNERDGLLVDPNSTQELQSSISKLVQNESLREAFGESSRLKAQEYDENMVFPKIEEYYKKIVTCR